MKSLLNKWSITENILLAIVWGAVIVTGFLALGAIVGGMDVLIAFSGVHRIAVRLGLAYTAIHIYRKVQSEPRIIISTISGITTTQKPKGRYL